MGGEKGCGKIQLRAKSRELREQSPEVRRAAQGFEADFTGWFALSSQLNSYDLEYTDKRAHTHVDERPDSGRRSQQFAGGVENPDVAG